VQIFRKMVRIDQQLRVPCVQIFRKMVRIDQQLRVPGLV
jgi:hypothetical protein